MGRLSKITKEKGESSIKKPTVKIGDWVVISDDGLWGMDGFSFPTKSEAIEEISCAKLDARTKPRVKRITKGVYTYHPKDCDTGEFAEEYGIEKVTRLNVNRLNELLEEQWNSDPSYCAFDTGR